MKNHTNTILILLILLVPVYLILDHTHRAMNESFDLIYVEYVRAFGSAMPIISGLAFIVLMHRKLTHIDGVSTFKKYIIGNILFDSFIIGVAFVYGVAEGGGEAFMLALFCIPYVVIINILVLIDVGAVAILRKRKED